MSDRPIPPHSAHQSSVEDPRRIPSRSSVVRTRQYVAPPNILEQYGAKVLLRSIPTTTPIPDHCLNHQSQRHHHEGEIFQHNDKKELETDGNIIMAGVSLHGWNITTFQGCIANEEWLERMTHMCESMAQPKNSTNILDEDDDTMVVAKPENYLATTTANNHRNRHGIPSSSSLENLSNNNRLRRKLNLPEMVFGMAHVTLEQSSPTPTTPPDNGQTFAENDGDPNENSNHNSITDDDNNDETGTKCIQPLQLCWNTPEALVEWAKAHTLIPLPVLPPQDTNDDDPKSISSSLPSKKQFRNEIQPISTKTSITAAISEVEKKQNHTETGVSILQSVDAELWNHTKREVLPWMSSTNNHHHNMTVEITSSPSAHNNPAAHFPPPPPLDDQHHHPSNIRVMVHYDWTYSTPYSGHIGNRITTNPDNFDNDNDRSKSNNDDDDHNHSQHFHWQQLVSSGIQLNLLTDQSVPILYYDDIILFEDDLHDNGQVQYSVKVRVMPQCAYILARLFVRVDQVVLRLRETRVLLEFFQDDSVGNVSETTSSPIYESTLRFPRIFRDISWRECPWKDLSQHSLPMSVSAWCSSNGGGGGRRSDHRSSSHTGVTSTSSSSLLIESPEFRSRLARLPLQSNLPSQLCPHAVLQPPPPPLLSQL